jgi:exosortase D (VPLPA-CTERM-specific)
LKDHFIATPGRKTLLLATGIFATLFLVVSYFLLKEPFIHLYQHWQNEDTSYCIVVPFVFLFFVLRKHKELAANIGGSMLPAYGFLAAFTFFFVTGKLGSLETLVNISMWALVCSVFMFIFGGKALKTLAFPFFLLLFSVPPPPFIVQMVSFKLKLYSSGFAVDMLHLLNVSVYRTGNIIDLGVTQLQVVDACSGLRYFFPTILVGLILGQLFHAQLWAKATLLLLSPLVSLASNAIRITITGLLVKNISVEMAKGFFHDFAGLAVYTFSIVVLGCLSFFLRFKEKKFLEAQGKPYTPMEMFTFKNFSLDGFKPLSARPLALHFLVLFLFITGLYFTQQRITTTQPVKPLQSFSHFPETIGEWQGKRVYLSREILDQLWADDYITGNYKNTKTGNVMHLLVTYYEYQTTKHTAHSPTSCLLSGGWIMDKKEELPPDPGTGRDFPIRRMVMHLDNSRILSNFWFEQRGRVITNEYYNKLLLIWDGMTRQRTDGALVRAEMYLAPGQSIEEGQAVLDEFLVQLRRILGEYIPGEEKNALVLER